jgi:HlyD family secretion protein
VLWAAASGCAPQPGGIYQGYLEGEYVYVAAPLAGQLVQLPVKRGQQVPAGELLFVLEHAAEEAAVAEAEQRLAQAQARLDNLNKGKRPSEIASLEARLAQANAALELAGLELKRQEDLRAQSVVSQDKLDAARAQRNADRALVDSLAADLETARLGGRVDEIRAAAAEVEASQAAVRRARWSLEQKTQRSPTAGPVHDTLYRVGEWVPAGSPVVALLPPGNLKVRFFVAEPELASIRPGQGVSVSRDGAQAPVPATVNYVSTRAEFTPPVIYSREMRAKLTYMIEAAVPADAAGALHAGQPVEVRLAGP